MRVAEIFKSIQGESTWAGLPCSFIRLTGCNLDCTYCDTPYAKDGGVEMAFDEVIGKVEELGVELVELTGGEPLMNPEAPRLIKELLDRGHKVLIETNGSLDLGAVDPRAVCIMDIKTPSSGMHGRMRLENLALLKPADELKLVLCDRTDYEWARAFIASHETAAQVLFSPAFGLLDPAELVGWMMDDGLNVRLNMQLHKYIFGPDRRGV